MPNRPSLRWNAYSSRYQPVGFSSAPSSRHSPVPMISSAARPLTLSAANTPSSVPCPCCTARIARSRQIRVARPSEIPRTCNADATAGSIADEDNAALTC
jgi:hypothetical protein